MQIIDFAPPLEGLDAEFNTVRMGTFYCKRLTAGQKVALMHTKLKLIFGYAEVIGFDKGSLASILLAHAAKNHTQLGLDHTQAPERLMGVMEKLYGPHIAAPHRTATVVHLRRLHGELPRPDA